MTDCHMTDCVLLQKNYTVLGVDNGLSPLWISHLRAPFKPAGFPLNLEEKVCVIIIMSLIIEETLCNVSRSINRAHLLIHVPSTFYMLALKYIY